MILLFNTINVCATSGQAGVGVLNAPTKFGSVRIEKQDSFFRVYLTVSDYNSFSDVYDVTIILEDNDVEMASFNFRQYEDVESYQKINEFSQSSAGDDLLSLEKCSVQRYR